MSNMWKLNYLMTIFKDDAKVEALIRLRLKENIPLLNKL
jgi:hypothetical protein